MPFQGNPNAGQPDPALLNLLFQQKAQREERAYKMQQDALAAQRQAQLDAAEEARKTEKHQMDLLVARAGLVDKLRAMAPELDSAQRTVQDVTSRNFTQADLLGGGGGEDFASIVAQNDPTTADQLQRSNMAEASLATQLSMASELQQQLAPGIDRRTAVDAALGLGQAVESERVRTADIDLRKELAKERRTEDMQNRAAYRDEAIQLRRGTRIVEEENRFIASKVKAAKKARADGNEELYTLLMQDANVVAAERDAKLTANQPEWAGKNMEALIKNNAALDNYVGMVQVLDPIIANPDIIGTDATFRTVVGNAINVLGDLGAAVMPTMDKYAKDDRIDPNVRAKTYNAIVRGVNEDGTPIAAAKLAAIRTRWLILNALDPGRVAVAQLNDMEDATQFNGFLVSQKLATERAKAARNELLQGVDSAQRTILLLRPEAEFDDSGRLIIGGHQPRNAAGDIFSTQQQTAATTPPAASVDRSKTAIDIVLDPAGSLGDAIDAAKKGLNTPLSGKKKNGAASTSPGR